MTDPDTTHALITTYWTSANARDWTTFASTLADDVVYELPQTRERIRGRDTYLRFNTEYPGDWQVATTRVVAAADQAATWIDVAVSGTTISATTFFKINDSGRITHITDFWPEPYEPPPGREHLVERW